MKSSRNALPDIYDYHDYRKFLRDWLSYLASKDKKWSIRELSRLSGQSFGHLSKFFKNERKLSKKGMQKIIMMMKLDKSKESYLNHLYDIAESNDAIVRIEAIQKIEKIIGVNG